MSESKPLLGSSGSRESSVNRPSRLSTDTEDDRSSEMDKAFTLGMLQSTGTSSNGNGSGADEDRMLTQEERKQLTWKERVFQTLDNPNFSPLSRIVNIYILVLIVGSTITFCLESIYTLSETDAQKHAWFVTECFIIANFTVDYLIRLFTCPKLVPFVLAPLNIIDLIAIVPFYIELIVGEEGGGAGGLAVARVLRLVRIFRILKLGKTVEVINLLGTAFYRCREGIMVLLFMVTLAMVFFSSFMFYAESSICALDKDIGKWVYTSGIKEGEISPYQNIVATFWWTVVTLTTVGYGDTYPVSGTGKFVASLTMLSGILVLAFPITMIGVHLTDTYAEFRKNQEIRDRLELKEKGKKYEKKSKAELISLLDTYHQRIAEVSASVAGKVKEVNDQMAELENMQEKVETLVSVLKESLKEKP